jgi:hypothetical protein
MLKATTNKRMPLRRRRIAQAAKDVQRSLKDTERRGAPNDVPSKKRQA